MSRSTTRRTPPSTQATDPSWASRRRGELTGTRGPRPWAWGSVRRIETGARRGGRSLRPRRRRPPQPAAGPRRAVESFDARGRTGGGQSAASLLSTLPRRLSFPPQGGVDAHNPFTRPRRVRKELHQRPDFEQSRVSGTRGAPRTRDKAFRTHRSLRESTSYTT